MAVKMRQGNLPHIYWIDLKNDGVFTECAVMKQDDLGNVHFFSLKSIDTIDKRRLARILTNRNATHFELWDLMSNITLNNGVNALAYFHQLVQVMTPGGRIMRPQEGVIGVGDVGTIDTRGAENRKTMEDAANIAASAAAKAAAAAATQAIRDLQNPQVVQQPSPEAPVPTPRKRSPTKKATPPAE